MTLKSASIRAGVLAVGLVSWEAIARNFATTLFTSSPYRLAQYSFENSRSLIVDYAYTQCESLLGFVIAGLIALATTHFAFSYQNQIEKISRTFTILQVIPLIVFAPLIVSVFGYGISGKVAMAFLFSYVSLTISMLSAFSAIPQSYHDLVHVNGISKFRASREVYLPLITPDIFSGLKVCAGLSVLGSVVAEFTGAAAGLGKNIFVSSTRLDPELMWISVILTTLAGMVIIGCVKLAERRLGQWYL